MSDAGGPGRKGGRRAEEGPAFSVVDRRPSYDGAHPPEAGTSEAGTPEAPAQTVPRAASEAEELRARAEEAERRAREISAAYRRIDAERDAFRDRLARDLERRLDIARAELMRRILPVLDDLDRALAAARRSPDPAALLSGVGLIRERLRQALAAEGVEEIDTVGRPFDPAVAEAVATEACDDARRDHEVVEEVERGYRLRGALLRPAKVRVLRGPGRAGDEPAAGDDPFGEPGSS